MTEAEKLPLSSGYRRGTGVVTAVHERAVLPECVCMEYEVAQCFIPCERWRRMKMDQEDVPDDE